MAKKPVKPTLQQPDQTQIKTEETRRERAEHSAKGTIDGRTLKRSSRQEQINIKTSVEAKKKFDRLRMRLDVPYNVVFEQALDVLEAKLNAEGGDDA
jgi:hypothetical protein